MVRYQLKLVFVCFLVGLNIQGYAQVSPSYNLYKLCKVWGYMKYFHSEVSTCKVNWDSILIATIPAVKNATTTTELDAALFGMITLAGPMAIPTSTVPVIDPTLNVNYDTSWIPTIGFLQPIVDLLRDISAKFRPNTNCYVRYTNYSTGSSKGFLTFDDTVSFANPSYPDETFRLLVAFRYWNIIRYFNPNNKLMDTSWDSSLVAFIPRFIDAGDETSYHLTLLEFITKIDDTHASSSGSAVTYGYFGYYFPNFKIETIENKLIVTNIAGASNLHIGDIIIAINDISADTLRKQLVKYIPHSNPAALNRDMNTLLISGVPSSVINLTIERAGASMSVQAKRTMSGSAYYNNVYYVNTKLPVAKKYPAHKTGYMNLGNIEDESNLYDIYDSVGDFENLIFDIRNYPNFSVPYTDFFADISDDNRDFCLLTIPSVTFPGVLSSIEASSFGSGADPYPGKIYVLVDENTQSAAEFSTMALQSMPNVVVVGSQTAGADGNITRLVLPGNFYTYFSTLQPIYPDGTIAQRMGVKIDVPVTRTINGVLTGKDEILENALLLATGLSSAKADRNRLVKIFPNPSSGIVQVSVGEKGNSSCKIEVNDILGKMVLSENKIFQQGHLTLDCTDLPKGIYLMRVDVGEDTVVEKLIIE